MMLPPPPTARGGRVVTGTGAHSPDGKRLFATL
jgi:hypothetical protein